MRMIAFYMIKFRHLILSEKGKSTKTDWAEILLDFFLFIRVVSIMLAILFIFIIYNLPTVIALVVFPI